MTALFEFATLPGAVLLLAAILAGAVFLAVEINHNTTIRERTDMRLRKVEEAPDLKTVVQINLGFEVNGDPGIKVLILERVDFDALADELRWLADALEKEGSKE